MEMKQITLQRITLEFRHAYNKCLSCLRDAENEKNKFAFEQRIDEILLLYSSIADVSVNESKKRLFVISEQGDGGSK